MSTDGENLAEVMSERRQLMALAFRMLGTLGDAEDAVQEGYFRWYRLDDADRAAIENPQAWLTRVVSRICLDVLGSARARRENYVGEWLPEPVPADLFLGTPVAADPLDAVALDDAVSMALLVVLEAMTPAERVSFVLHDVFAVPFPEIAEIVGRSPAAVRQLATSGRRRVQDGRAVPVERSEHDAVVAAFGRACREGDLASLMALLDPAVTLRSDGGGLVRAAINPVHGPSNVARFVLGVLAKQAALDFVEEATADGLGYSMRLGDRVYGITNLRVEAGLVTDVWLVVTPEKLGAWQG
ncbi:RNA polymerase sigma factor SigJ [Frondihabitans sucicola]|uniref:RNA polymerase sigma factor SigJ n=1 Tax=Frondihabitans sucicola TaxID=1268041 RepID=UPI0025743829|nr:RNA polymerase sigma factor SigJ [Frondihabitans sucicola]